MIIFEELEPFKKDFKHLKKYRSLDDDFLKFKKVLETDGENLTGLVRLSMGANLQDIPFYKAKKFRCKSLGGGAMSGIRVIFCWQQKDNDALVSFIEIYYKGQQTNHNPERIINFCKERKLLK